MSFPQYFRTRTRGRGHRGWIAWLLATVAFCATAAGQEAPALHRPTLDDVQGLMDRLADAEPEAGIRDLLRQAGRALDQARDRRSAGEFDKADRALGIAAAAATLAERRLALHRERERLRTVGQRFAATEARARVSRRALENTLAARADAERGDDAAPDDTGPDDTAPDDTGPDNTAQPSGESRTP